MHTVFGEFFRLEIGGPVYFAADHDFLLSRFPDWQRQEHVREQPVLLYNASDIIRMGIWPVWNDPARARRFGCATVDMVTGKIREAEDFPW
jgi:hypothetical protein